MKKLSCLLLINLLACSVARAQNVGIGTNSYITIQSLKGVSTNGLSVFDMRFTAFLFLDGLS